MSELRQDRTTGAWVIVAPERSRRPQDWQADLGQPGPDHAADCPFCPGHEAKLAGILEEIPDEAPPGWRLRVVPNAYPLVSALASRQSGVVGPHPVVAARGRHEVVIESPRHDADLAARTDAEIAMVVATYHRRYRALLALPDIRAAVVFRNRGARAGASLRHPHSQIVGLAVLPPKQRAMARWGRERHRATGRCVTCEEIALERQFAARVVEETESFLAVVPFAAAGPYELWLIPRRHAASFGASQPHELSGLAALLGRCLRRLFAVLGPVAYNLVIDSAGGRYADAPYLHWRLRILPDLVTAAGFELGSGFTVNPSSPEADAAALRQAKEA